MTVLFPVTFIGTHFLNPGQRVHLHQRVRDADDMHPVHDTLWNKRRCSRGRPRSGADSRGPHHAREGKDNINGPPHDDTSVQIRINYIT